MASFTYNRIIELPFSTLHLPLPLFFPPLAYFIRSVREEKKNHVKWKTKKQLKQETIDQQNKTKQKNLLSFRFFSVCLVFKFIDKKKSGTYP